jgi:XRE family transcriptional regulator, regulator of sulfur utilization
MPKQSERAVIQCAFGMAVRTLRTRRGIAQEKLALEAGIDRGYMSSLERGLHCPTLETIFKFLPLLGVSFTEFAAELEKSVRRARRQPKPPPQLSHFNDKPSI